MTNEQIEMTNEQIVERYFRITNPDYDPKRPGDRLADIATTNQNPDIHFHGILGLRDSSDSVWLFQTRGDATVSYHEPEAAPKDAPYHFVVSAFRREATDKALLFLRKHLDYKLTEVELK